MQEDYEAANAKTEELRQNKKKYKDTIRKASELLDGLADEKGRWIESSKLKKELYQSIIGDVLMSAGIIAYLGAFFKDYRIKCIS